MVTRSVTNLEGAAFVAQFLSAFMTHLFIPAVKLNRSIFFPLIVTRIHISNIEN